MEPKKSGLICSKNSHGEAPAVNETLDPFVVTESTTTKVDGTPLSAAAAADAGAAADARTLPTTPLNSNSNSSDEVDNHQDGHGDKAIRHQKITKGAERHHHHHGGHGRLSDEESAAMAQMAMALAQNVAGSG